MKFTLKTAAGQNYEAYAYTGGKPFDAALPAVVFVHGALHDHSCWNLLARWCAHHGRSVLALDLPGHGRSEGPPLTDIEALGGWVLQVMAALLSFCRIPRQSRAGVLVQVVAFLGVILWAGLRPTSLALGVAVFVCVTSTVLALALLVGVGVVEGERVGLMVPEMQSVDVKDTLEVVDKLGESVRVGVKGRGGEGEGEGRGGEGGGEGRRGSECED
jgi:hypothetical protein